jgi:ureidoglycolate lyase
MTRLLKVELLTAEVFRPYGYVISKDPGTPLIKQTPPQFTSRMPFEVDDGKAEFVYALLERKEFKVSALERHLKVTQGFFPMSNGPAIITVAPATDAQDPASVPDPDSVRAFLLESDKAFVLHRGVWHGTILPLEPHFAYILATRDKTTDESTAPLYDGDVQIRDLGVTCELIL